MKARLVLLSVILLRTLVLYSQIGQPVTSYNIISTTPLAATKTSTGFGPSTDPTYPSGTTFKSYYGQTSTGSGVERVINGFSVGSVNYINIQSPGNKPFDTVIVKRHPSIAGDTINTLYEYSSISGSNLYFNASYVESLGAVINSFACNRGSDNTFTNDGSTHANIERIDLIKKEGIICANPQWQGFLINDRGGNDAFKAAVIKNINTSCNVIAPFSLTSVVNNNTDTWGRVGPTVVTTVMSRREGVDAALRPKQNIAAQSISGVFISFADLGITAGTTVYGVSLFPADVTSGMDLINLTNVPGNTNETAGGLDLMAGVGFFVESSILHGLFSNFTAHQNNSTVSLTWSTLSNTNTNNFEVERWKDENEWEVIGSVLAWPGVTNSNKYYFTDHKPKAGLNVYRVKQDNKDGSFNYSKAMFITINKPSNYLLYPNPAKDFLYISSDALLKYKMARLSIISMDGKTVAGVNYQRVGDKIKVDIASLLNETYIVLLESEEGKENIGSFVVQK